MRLRWLTIAIAGVIACGSFGTTPTDTTDGGTVPDSASSAFCANVPAEAFCADFEHTGEVQFGWSKLATTDNSSVTFVPGEGSFGRAARAFVPADATSEACRRAHLAYKSQAQTTRVHASWSYKLVDDGRAVMARVGHDRGCTVSVLLGSNPTAFVETDPSGTIDSSATRPLGMPHPLGRWIRGSVDVDFETSSYTVKLDHLPGPIEGPIPRSCRRSDHALTFIGLHCAPPGNDQIEVHVDEIVIAPR